MDCISQFILKNEKTAELIQLLGLASFSAMTKK